MRTMIHKVSTGPTSKCLCVRKASIVNTFVHSTINTGFITLRNHEWAVHKQKFREAFVSKIPCWVCNN